MEAVPCRGSHNLTPVSCADRTMGRRSSAASITTSILRSLSQRSFQLAQELDLAPEIRGPRGLCGPNQQVDIASTTPVIHARAEKPHLGTFTKDLLGGLSNSRNLISSQTHLYGPLGSLKHPNLYK